MFCVHCGKEIPEGAVVCPQCGEKVEKDINFSDVTNYAGQKAQQVSEGIQNQVMSFRQSQVEESRKVKDVSDLFVNEDEQQKAVIGGGYLSNMINSGVLGKGFGVLTDRRLYYRGKCYYKVGGRFMKTDEDSIVDLQDISSTGFTYTRHLWLLILAVIIFVAGSIFAIDNEDISVFICMVILTGCFGIPYLLLKKTIYTVTFAGGSLSIKASAYGVKNVRIFDKALHLAKDELVSK